MYGIFTQYLAKTCPCLISGKDTLVAFTQYSESNLMGTGFPVRRPSNEASNDLSKKLLSNVSEQSFEQWYREHQTTENVLDGQAFFNTPSPAKSPERHSPSQLMQCPRKASYRRKNAPKEGGKPNGVFWVGEQIEEELVV
jgi:hypothetical protein